MGGDPIGGVARTLHGCTASRDDVLRKTLPAARAEVGGYTRPGWLARPKSVIDISAEVGLFHNADVLSLLKQSLGVALLPACLVACQFS